MGKLIQGRFTISLCQPLEPPEETWQLVLHDPEGILDHLKDIDHWKVPDIEILALFVLCFITSFLTPNHAKLFKSEFYCTYFSMFSFAFSRAHRVVLNAPRVMAAKERLKKEAFIVNWSWGLQPLGNIRVCLLQSPGFLCFHSWSCTLGSPTGHSQ